VRFTSAEEDARRRDFTINGLFFDPIENRVIDYVGGRDDLAARNLRAIGDPAERFGEDHLRMLRAVRFAARFNFQIEAKTAAAITALAARIKGISPERVGEELRLMLTPPTRSVAWGLLWKLSLAKEIFRLLPKVPQGLDESRSIFLQVAPGEPISFGLSLAAAALCASAQAEPGVDVVSLLEKARVSHAVRAMRQALRISNEESDQMYETLLGLHPLLEPAAPPLAQKKRFLAKPTAADSRRLLNAMAKLGLHVERIASLQAEFAELEKTEVGPVPFVSGDDLIAAGLEPGPIFRQILEAVYDAQLEGRVSAKEEALKLAGELHRRK
jgi:tRNA nucleotidyltransferase/poly(A) polymerase